MEKKVRVTGNSQADLTKNIYTFLKGEILNALKCKKITYTENPSGNDTTFIIKNNADATIVETRIVEYSRISVEYTVKDGSDWRICLAVTINANAYNADTKSWSVDLAYNEGISYFHLKRATMCDDTLPVQGAYYGAICYSDSIDGKDEIMLFRCINSSGNWHNRTITYKGYANTFWNLANYAIPPGKIALFNPGNGHHFFKDIYRHSANVAGLAIPDFSYQEIAGLGRFFIFPGPIWIKEA